jgi:hypothetical protein
MMIFVGPINDEVIPVTNHFCRILPAGRHQQIRHTINPSSEANEIRPTGISGIITDRSFVLPLALPAEALRRSKY